MPDMPDMPSIVRPPSASYRPSSRPQWSLLSFAAGALPLAIPLGFAGAVIFAAATYLITPTYLSVARFTVNTSQSNPLGGLAALAQQSGFNFNQNGAEGSLDYWQQLVVGRAVRERVLAHGVDVKSPKGTRHIDLRKWYDLDDLPVDKSRESALSQLAKHLSSGADSRANILSLAASDRDPRVAAALAATTMEELNAFNIETRQSSARQNRVFIQHRLAEAKNELRDAQQALTDFYVANRGFQNSPPLRAREQQLREELDARTQVYQTLATQFEQARIQEVRDVPAITIIENPVPAMRRSSPNRVAALFLGLLVGVAVAFAWSAWVEWKARLQADAEHRELLVRSLNRTRLGRRIARWLIGPLAA